MAKIRKGDLVTVGTGKDRGKQGKVLQVFPEKGRALVEGIQRVQSHIRPTQESPKGGLVPKELPVSLSNLKPVCPKCNQGTRVGWTRTTDGAKERMCKRCSEMLS